MERERKQDERCGERQTEREANKGRDESSEGEVTRKEQMKRKRMREREGQNNLSRKTSAI